MISSGRTAVPTRTASGESFVPIAAGHAGAAAAGKIKTGGMENQYGKESQMEREEQNQPTSTEEDTRDCRGGSCTPVRSTSESLFNAINVVSPMICGVLLPK